MLWACIVVVQSLSPVRLFEIPWTAACPAPLFSVISQSLLKFMSIESGMLSNHRTLCHPLSSCLASFPASGSFPMLALCIRWPKNWSFSFNITFQWIFRVEENQPNQSGWFSSTLNIGFLINPDWFSSIRIDWFDLLATQGTLKSLLQHHNLKTSILQQSRELWKP